MRFRRIVASTLVAVSTVGVAAASTSSASAYMSGCQEDGGLRVELCIYQDTSADYVASGHEYVDVTDYRFHVRNIGGTQATLTGGSMTMLATVYGTCVSGCSSYAEGKVDKVTISLPSSANSGYTYKMTVPWHAATIRIDGPTANSVQAARADITFHFRGQAVTYHSDSLCDGSTVVGICD